MSVYMTGDIHGDPTRFSVDSFYEQKEFSNKEDNFVIICGDFGLVWNRIGKDKNEKYWLDWFEEKPFTVCFVDGNHENFDRLNAYPVEEWHGGKVHKIGSNVIHLMRGEIYEIEGKKFFCFGGASSHDISDGILDIEDLDWKEKAKNLDKKGKYMYRIKGLSWWPEELPSDEEMQNGIDNLEKHNWKIDYVISHTPTSSVVALLGHGLYKQDKLTKYLEEIRCKLDYNRWFAGHFHINYAVNHKDILLYEQIIRIL